MPSTEVENFHVTVQRVPRVEETCMANVVASASQGKRLPEVQAVMARCRQASAVAAATAIGAFRDECSEIGTQANSLVKAAIVAATVKDVSDFWDKSESSAAAFVSEAAALLPAQGPDKTIQTIKDICGDRASSINRYFEQLTT
jgi:predicted nucleic acid-binding protein